MSCRQVLRACYAMGAVMVGPTILVGVALALGGCEASREIPRDTASASSANREQR